MLVRAIRVAGDVPGHEFHGNQWVAYHGTSEENADKILKEGLKLDRYGEIWTTTSLLEAKTYARDAARGGNSVVLKISVPAKNGPAYDERKSSSSIRIYKEPVKAEHISRHSEHIGGQWRSASAKDGPLQAAADSQFKSVLVAVRHAFASGRAAIASKPSNAPKIAARAVKAALLKTLPGTLAKALKAGGDAGLKLLPKMRAASLRTAKDLPPVKLAMKFDVSDPNAIAWAREHAAELADGLSETTEEAVRTAIANTLETGDDAWDAVFEAVGSEARATAIARTEIMTAANEGQRQGWDQAVEAGLLPEDARKVWIATPGCCDLCDELDETETTLDGEYPDPGGDGPPLHPNCRCTEGIVG